MNIRLNILENKATVAGVSDQASSTLTALRDGYPKAPLDDHLVDRFGRRIGYLRLSLTRSCSMRCVYCRPSDHENKPEPDRLTPREIENLVRHLVEHNGLKKVRLTGGEPSSRRELIEIIERIAKVPGIDDLCMTTNALKLASSAKDYAQAGLQRVNISLDSLDAKLFAEMTGVDGLPRVLEAIEEAQKAGLGPVKLNTVVIRGQNEQSLSELVLFAADRGLEIRFIELMAMGPLADQWANRYVPQSQMMASLESVVADFKAMPQHADAAKRYHTKLHDGREVTIGFITPMSCHFCDHCNRIRVDADGMLFPCLMDQPRVSLRDALRPTFKPSRLTKLLWQGLNQKAETHPDAGPTTMTNIGG